jgi:hypothetical protein
MVTTLSPGGSGVLPRVRLTRTLFPAPMRLWRASANPWLHLELFHVEVAGKSRSARPISRKRGRSPVGGARGTTPGGDRVMGDEQKPKAVKLDDRRRKPKSPPDRPTTPGAVRPPR